MPIFFKTFGKLIFAALAFGAYFIYERVQDSGSNSSNDIYFIEANPNPAISNSDEFFKSINLEGISYEDMIEKVLSLAFSKK